MKYLITVLIALLSFSASASSQSVEAPGKIVYKMPSGELVTRAVSLIVPSRGDGDVILKGSNSELIATKFFTKERNGQILFFVVFKDFPGSEEGDISVFKGTYLRGTNKALYYGDVFLGEELDYSLDSDFLENHPGHFQHAAGFMFSTDIEM